MAKSIVLVCVMLALLGFAAAAKYKDGPKLDFKLPKQDEREYKCLARAKNCDSMDRCLNYKKCDDCAYKAMKSGGKKCPQLPTAWDVISDDPDFSIFAGIISAFGLEYAFNGTFTGTLLLPNNQAFAAYLGDIKVPLDAFVAYLPPWLFSVLQYHVLLRRVYSYQLRPIAYSTAYNSLNALPHKVTAVANSTCPNGNKGSKSCQSSYYLRDEQGFNVTFAMVDAKVYGGGVIHAINSVLQANDYYPSVTAALTRNPTAFSELTNLVLSLDQLLAPYNISILNTLETTAGSIAAPVNSAFIGLDTSGLTLQYATQTLLYHFCPVSATDPTPDAILRAPYSTNPFFNPCTTALGSVNTPGAVEGLLYSFAYKTPITFNASISYTSGKALPPPAEIVTNSATIIVANVKTPIASIVAINKVMLPPTGLPNPPLPN